MSEQFAYNGPVKTQYALNLTVVFILTQDSDNGIMILPMKQHKNSAEGSYHPSPYICPVRAALCRDTSAVFHEAAPC